MGIELLSEDKPEINGMLLNQYEENCISRKAMREEFNIYSINNNLKHRNWSPQKFGRHLHRLFPEVTEVRPANQQRHYKFPSLEQCRKFVFDKFGIELKISNQ